jgi:hypothetical protein
MYKGKGNQNTEFFLMSFESCPWSGGKSGLIDALSKGSIGGLISFRMGSRGDLMVFCSTLLQSIGEKNRWFFISLIFLAPSLSFGSNLSNLWTKSFSSWLCSVGHMRYFSQSRTTFLNVFLYSISSSLKGRLAHANS